jgi:hypothetical protein
MMGRQVGRQPELCADLAGRRAAEREQKIKCSQQESNLHRQTGSLTLLSEPTV